MGLMFPKSTPYRNKRHLMNVASLSCQVCGKDGATQAAHSNWGKHGKSFGRKADDQYTAAMCQFCHSELDQGHMLKKEQRQEMWGEAFRRTVKALVDSGKWPSDVPVPEDA
jgi:hypothetical protein